MKFTFKKEERLRSKALIDKLFLEGKSVLIPPFRLIYLPLELPLTVPIQIFFSVPKKRFKKANQRNLIRRRLKELYRLKKPFLYQKLNSKNKSYVMAFIYTSNTVLNSQYLDERINILFEEWQKRVGI
jgi:ribonuclease P protein component